MCNLHRNIVVSCHTFTMAAISRCNLLYTHRWIDNNNFPWPSFFFFFKWDQYVCRILLYTYEHICRGEFNQFGDALKSMQHTQRSCLSMRFPKHTFTLCPYSIGQHCVPVRVPVSVCVCAVCMYANFSTTTSQRGMLLKLKRSWALGQW